ncbi:peptidase [Luteimonas aquatica]|uniref:peptidase n=1 Tax=Luteimonas aquatica TaxID=450364 RepID=UPI001F596D51|nr:peptidase [Luteimonas aquatica]
MRLHAAMAVLLIAGLSACATDAPPAAPVADTPASPPMPGSDQDAHGCKPSAGYTWCAATNRCERAWELAEAKGFERTPEAFDRYCKNPPEGK